MRTVENRCEIRIAIRGVESLIADDKIYCIHIAESEHVIREHATLGKFPINTISEVKTVIDPTTSNPL